MVLYLSWPAVSYKQEHNGHGTPGGVNEGGRHAKWKKLQCISPTVSTSSGSGDRQCQAEDTQRGLTACCDVTIWLDAAGCLDVTVRLCLWFVGMAQGILMSRPVCHLCVVGMSLHIPQ